MRIAVLGAGVAGLVAAHRLTRGRATRSTSTSAGPGWAARRRRSTSAAGTGSSATTTTCSPPTATSRRCTTSSGCRTSSSGGSSSVALLRPRPPVAVRRRRWTCCASSRCRRSARVRLGAAVLAIQRGAGNPAPFERVTARAWIERWMGRARLARAVGAAAARQVRRARRRRRDGLAAEQAAAAARRRRAPRRSSATRARSWEPLFEALRERDRGRRRARADRPPGGARRPARLRGHAGRARLVPRRPRPARVRRPTASPSATTRVLATLPSDVFEQLRRARRAARGLPARGCAGSSTSPRSAC